MAVIGSLYKLACNVLYLYAEGHGPPLLTGVVQKLLVKQIQPIIRFWERKTILRTPTCCVFHFLIRSFIIFK